MIDAGPDRRGVDDDRQRERFKRRLLAQNPELAEKYRKLAWDDE